MSVDFTKENKKTNVEYLRDYIKDNEEANEFLDAIQEELTASKDITNDLKDEIDTLENDKEELKTEIRELEEEGEYEDSIDTKLGSQGVIRWSVDNIACKSMMEELNEAIGRGVPILKIETLLRAL